MSKNVIVSGQTYEGITEVRINTAEGSTARFLDADNVVTPSGALEIVANGSYDVSKYAAANVLVSSDSDAIEDGLVAGGLTEYQNDRVEKVAVALFYGNGTIESISFANAAIVPANFCTSAVNLKTVSLPKMHTAGKNAFSTCSSLEEIVLPKVINIPTFLGSARLKKGDFGNISISNGSYNAQCLHSTAMETLILRYGNVVELTATCLANTPIANGTGYIYVPAALVSEYKANEVMSAYADQIRAIEDYPDICGGGA